MTQKSNDDSELNFEHIPQVGANKRAKKYLLEKAIYTLTFVGLISLTACSDVEPTKQTGTAPIQSAKQVKSVQVDLISSPLDKQAFLGLIIPEVKEAAPCPFLSDKTVLKIVKANRNLKRRKTSNKYCYWSKNLGFSIKLTVEPLTTAKPIGERAYNLENKPVLKNQPEPGNNAVVLYDTTWGKERAYAISFEQDGNLIMIYVTGMSTDAERLTVAAKEVASKLPTAPILEVQQEKVNAFNMCSTWSESDIEAIIGTPVQVTEGDLDCKWETGTAENMKQIRVTIYSGKSYPWESLIKLGERDISGIGERGLMEKKRKRKNMPGHVILNALYDETLVSVSVTDTISDHEAVAIALSKNIDKRFK